VATPALKGQARKAVEHRAGHLQIIAAAGSGKTEVVSQRVVSLLADGVPASGIVAFTFTERAAAELKERIAARVEERLGRSVLDQLGNLFVGTIHAYCFQLLQTVVPRYETYDVLDENQLNAFLAREGRLMGVKDLDPDGKGRLWRSIGAFLKGLDVVENELLDPAVLPEPFASVLDEYLVRLERYRLLSFGQQIVRTVAELEKPEVRSLVHAQLRHLIVDEYQDINPAQERLIKLLTGADTHLCVVGDDDQAIYQWRGSDVSNIVDFQKRYPGVASFSIKKNRRSVPEIISTSNDFAQTIPGRLPKSMRPDRDASPTGSAVALWSSEFEADEAGSIAAAIVDLNAAGLAYRDIAVLVRTSAAYPRILEHFATFDIPVQPGGRTGLFDQPEARVLARTLCWLVGHDWRNQYERGTPVEESDLLDEYEQAFSRPRRTRRALSQVLHGWKVAAADDRRTADLIRELYELLEVLEVRTWDLDNPMEVNRLGTIARFSALLADFESVHRRARVDADNPGEQVGAQDRSIWFYKNLAIHVVNYAQGAYDGFDGEADASLDAVDVTTIHRAKGLEWPAVLVPSLTKGRFPSGKTGKPQPWPIPRDLFNAARYEGSDGDERRLFYVAMTRARDWLSISRHDRVNVNASPPSPYWTEVAEAVGVSDPDALDLPAFTPSTTHDARRGAPAHLLRDLVVPGLRSGVPASHARGFPTSLGRGARLRQGRAPRAADGRRGDEGQGQGSDRKADREAARHQLLPAGRQQGGPSPAQSGGAAARHHLRHKAQGRLAPRVGDRAPLRAPPRRHHRRRPSRRDPRPGGWRPDRPGHRGLQDLGLRRRRPRPADPGVHGGRPT